VIYGLWYGLSAADHATASAPPLLPAASAPIPASVDSNGINVNAPPPAVAIMPASASVAPAPAVPVATVAPAPVVPAAPASTETETEDEPAPASRLTIRAEKESWVLVTDDKGKALIDHVMKPGETFPVPDQDGLKLTTGNSGAIALVLDGKDLPKLSRQSSILHDIPLDIAKLKAPAAKSQ
jgi:cytoskeleton protein RodZ